MRRALLRSLCVAASVASIAGVPALAQRAASTSQGIFHGSTDIGVTQPGSSTFNAAAGAYRVAGGGEDVWGTADDFRFTWVKITGDATLSADVEVAQPATYPKAKGMLMFRRSLDPGSPYADVALHGDGHIDLQWRSTPGGPTTDTDLPAHGTVHLRIVRQGNRFTAYAGSAAGQPTQPPSITIPMPETVYVGIGVCSHSTSALQTVTFSEVHLQRSSGTGSITTGH